jgi:hypothetical protein
MIQDDKVQMVDRATVLRAEKGRDHVKRLHTAGSISLVNLESLVVWSRSPVTWLRHNGHATMANRWSQGHAICNASRPTARTRTGSSSVKSIHAQHHRAQQKPCLSPQRAYTPRSQRDNSRTARLCARQDVHRSMDTVGITFTGFGSRVSDCKSKWSKSCSTASQ